MLYQTAQTIPTPDINWLAIGPEVVLGVGAAVILLVEVQFKPARRALAVFTVLIVALASALSVWQWIWISRLTTENLDAARTPFAGMVILDPAAVFARFVLLAVTALGLAAGWKMIDRLGRRAAEALALVLLSTTGFSLMASSTNLVMIFLGLEVGSISLYVLAGITKERTESDEAAIKYFLLGSFASAVFVYGVALLYAGSGSLDGSTSFVVLKPGVLLIGLTLVVAGLGFKVTAAPFHAWAPDVYQGAPAGIVGYMAAVAKIGGFAALLRILVTAFAEYRSDWAPLVAAIAGLSMLLGTVLAIVQDDVRRLLAYSGVAHAGFILSGLVGRGASRQVWFYVAAYTIQLVGAFAVVATVGGATASRSAITDYSGLARRSPFMATSFAVLLLGMGGLPLTSGFIAKFGVFQEAWAGGFAWLVIVAVLASVAAFFVYLRLIVTMYMGEDAGESLRAPVATRTVLGIAVAATIVFGVLPRPLLDLAGHVLPG